jgi:toxin ParE1/3/4
MDFKIVWTEPAVQNLQDATAYISRDNLEAAVRFGNELFQHVEVLNTFPHIGPVYPRGSNGNVREIVFRKYRIFYRVNENQKAVEILAVWHGARQEPSFDE